MPSCCNMPCAKSPPAMSPPFLDSESPSPPSTVPCMRSCSPARDSLFLLEVLVDKVTFKKAPCFADKEFKTCVSVTSPALAPFEICDDEPGSGPPTHSPFSRNFNNGKSCLFCMKEADINKAMSKFPIRIQVFRTLPCGCIPTKILMGQAVIDMTKEFIETRNRHIENPNAVSYQALKDTFELNVDGESTGEISMYIRISCFGKLICTKFQGAGGSLALGQGGNGVMDRSCKYERDYQTPDTPCACGAAFGHGGAVGRAGGRPPGSGGVCPETGSPCPRVVDVYNSTPCERDDLCYCCGPRPKPPDPATCRNTDKYCLHVPRDCCPPGNRVIFQMPTDSCGTGHRQRMHFNTAPGFGDIKRDDPNTPTPKNEEYPGVVCDLGKQVIKLRIGRTIEWEGRKSKLEYQFMTPVATAKGVSRIDARTAQCDPTYCPPCCGCPPRTKKAETKKIDAKTETKKAESKKTDTKKAETKKTDTKK